MKKNLTELVFILDKSGSMSGLESDTIGGFNATINKQKDEEGEALVSVVLFSDVSKVLYDRIKIEDVKQMTKKEYYVNGCTALYDAIGGAIHHIKNVHKYIREEDKPEKTMFIITTDGYENASREYDIYKINKMINEMKKINNWEFIFIGANIDAIKTARAFGIDEDNAVNYIADEEGTKKNYKAMDKAIRSYRRCGKIDEKWKVEVEEDYKKRTNK